jgi:integrase
MFCNPDCSPLKPDTVSASVSLLFRKLKLPKGASLHTPRHTHGSLLAAGVPLTDVSKRLGHTNPHVTATVDAHALLGHGDLAAQVWEDFQKGANTLAVKSASHTRSPSGRNVTGNKQRGRTGTAVLP